MDKFVEKFLALLLVLSPLPLRGSTYTDSVRYSAREVVVEGSRVDLVGDAKMWYRDLTLSAGKITIFVDRDLLVAEGLEDSSQTPVLRQGREKLEGARMVYNFRTGRGAVWKGRTSFQKGIYRGEKVVRSEEGVLYVRGGTYTTCDRDPPHYYFYSPRMKVILDDKVIAHPVIFYLWDFPILRLPFMIFPIRKDRHSGWLRPNYGSTSREGRYIRNLGYYFAPSDYWDLKLRADVYEKVGLVLSSEFMYALRYRLRGSLRGSCNLREGRRRWDLELRHDQDLSPRLKFRVEGHFVSDRDYLRQVRFDPAVRMRRTLRSTATLSQSWGGGGGFSLSLRQVRYLDREEERYTLPNISLSLPGYTLAGRKLYFRPSLRVHNSLVLSGGRWTRKTDISGSSGLSGSLRLGWATFSPSASMLGRALWEGGEFSHSEEASASLGLRTTVYGLFPVERGKLRAVRHVLRPSISVRSSGSWEDGRPSSWRTDMSVSLSNLFQMKWGRGRNTRKLEVLSLSFSSGYASHRLSDLRTSVRSSFRALDLRAELRHSFYRGDRLSLPSLRELSLNASFRVSGGGKPSAGGESSWVPGVDVSGMGPWGLVLSGYLRKPTGERATFWMRGAAQASPTSKWRMRYSFNYDLGKGRMVAHEIYIYRDLHCWEASFQWSPSGMRRGYYFVLRIKELPEIKVEKRRWSG